MQESTILYQLQAQLVTRYWQSRNTTRVSQAGKLACATKRAQRNSQKQAGDNSAAAPKTSAMHAYAHDSSQVLRNYMHDRDATGWRTKQRSASQAHAIKYQYFTATYVPLPPPTISKDIRIQGTSPHHQQHHVHSDHELASTQKDLHNFHDGSVSSNVVYLGGPKPAHCKTLQSISSAAASSRVRGPVPQARGW